VWNKYDEKCYGLGEEQPVVCSDYDGNKPYCTKQGCTWNKFNELCGDDTVAVCSDYTGTSKEECRAVDCEWNKYIEVCYAEGEEPTIVCPDYNGDKTLCTKLGCDWDKHTELCGEETACGTFTTKETCKGDCLWNKHMVKCFGPDEPQIPVCSDYDGDKSPCKKLGCSWDKHTELCSDL